MKPAIPFFTCLLMLASCSHQEKEQRTDQFSIIPLKGDCTLVDTLSFDPVLPEENYYNQLQKNQKIFDTLHATGIPYKVRRKIIYSFRFHEYWFFYSLAISAGSGNINDFIKIVQKKKFEIGPSKPSETIQVIYGPNEGSGSQITYVPVIGPPYTLEISRTDTFTLDKITRTTHLLAQLASKNRGRLTGWRPI